MSTIDEKRVYGDRAGATEAYVASGVGIVRVSVAGETVGEFGLVERCVARDLAASEHAVAVATDDDVLVRPLETGQETGENRENGDGENQLDPPETAFRPTAFGDAVAVGFDGDTLLAAAPNGRIARWTRSSEADWSESDARGREQGRWDPIESPSLALEVRAIDGDLVGTADGVYRVRGEALEYVGLSDVRDVSSPGVPLAATGDGLYALGNGWIQSRSGDFDVVCADPLSDRESLERAHAVTGLDVLEHREREWVAFARTSVPVVDVAYGETVYAATENGTFLAASEEDPETSWRSRTLGVGDVTGLEIVPGKN